MIRTKRRLKTLSVYAIAIGFMMASCKKETREKIQNAKNEMEAATTIMNNATSMQERAAALAEKTPVTNEQFKAWLPESLDGIQRSAYKVGNNTFATATSVKGTYKKDNGEFVVEVVDGAGNMAGLVIMAGVANKVEMEEEDEFKHIKTVKKSGIEAKQTFYKEKNITTLKFLYDDRFLVDIRAEGFGVDETWDLLETLDLEGLQDLTD